MASDLESPSEACSFPSYFFFFPNFKYSIGFLKFVADMIFCGLLTKWSLYYGWLGFGLEGFLKIRNLYKNFLLHIHVVRFLFYICVLPVHLVYLWHFSFLTSNICLTLCNQKKKRKSKFDVFTFDSFETIIEYTPTTIFIFFNSMVLFWCGNFLNFCLVSTIINTMFSTLFLIMCNT